MACTLAASCSARRCHASGHSLPPEHDTCLVFPLLDARALPVFSTAPPATGCIPRRTSKLTYGTRRPVAVVEVDRAATGGYDNQSCKKLGKTLSSPLFREALSVDGEPVKVLASYIVFLSRFSTSWFQFIHVGELHSKIRKFKEGRRCKGYANLT